ncbi:hypothetical protein ACFE04_003560 [Oxalis oulophora]
MVHLAAAIDQIESNILRCPDSKYVEGIIAAINFVHAQGDSVGGVISCIVRSVHVAFDLLEMLKKEEEMLSAIKERQQKTFLKKDAHEHKHHPLIFEPQTLIGGRVTSEMEHLLHIFSNLYIDDNHIEQSKLDDEDDDDDGATEKARRFYDRKDENPRGAGNSKLTTFG